MAAEAAYSRSSSSSSYGRGVGGEVRRIHIIYFLTQMGRIQHPHLIRVHHLNRNGGVHLRDVKRWLGDLRGKEMPDAFAWSYKRRYKNGYVWQDLLDDDLITPFSDNEYVLKGSEIFPTCPFDASWDGERKGSFSMVENDGIPSSGEDGRHGQPLPIPDHQVIQPNQISSLRKPETDDTPTRRTSSSSEEYSPAFDSHRFSTLTDDSTNKPPQQQHPSKDDDNIIKLQPNYDNISTTAGHEEMGSSSSTSTTCTATPTSSSFSSTMSSNINNNYNSQQQSSSSFGRSTSCKSHSRTSKMLRNLMSCGAVDTNDAALVALSKQNPHINNDVGADRKIYTGGEIRVFGTQWNQQRQSAAARKSLDGKKRSKQQSGRVVSAAYKPVGAPTCSQCGKRFRPEKLHAHMKSCRGMKGAFVTTSNSMHQFASQKSPRNQPAVTTLS